jgi:hypothetical protein
VRLLVHYIKYKPLITDVCFSCMNLVWIYVYQLACFLCFDAASGLDSVIAVGARWLCVESGLRLTLLWLGVESSWNVMAHGGPREGKWRGNWRMQWVASTLHTNSEHGVSSITTADAHTSAASSRLNWRPRQFKWTRPFRRKTKSGFCVCAITFQRCSAIFCVSCIVPPVYYRL